MALPDILANTRKRNKSEGYRPATQKPSDDLILQTLKDHGVDYVHGSRTPSLAGVAQHGGLLSVLRLHEKYPGIASGQWLPTGENTFTLGALRRHLAGQVLTASDECDLNGVSLFKKEEYRHSWWDYAERRLGADTHKVLYGTGDIHPLYIGELGYQHHYVPDMIPTDAIKAVFVAPTKAGRIRADLEAAGHPEMAAKIEPIISPRSASAPERRHSWSGLPSTPKAADLDILA